jgi:hypothetical protein
VNYDTPADADNYLAKGGEIYFRLHVSDRYAGCIPEVTTVAEEDGSVKSWPPVESQNGYFSYVIRIADVHGFAAQVSVTMPFARITLPELPAGLRFGAEGLQAGTTICPPGARKNMILCKEPGYESGLIIVTAQQVIVAGTLTSEGYWKYDLTAPESGVLEVGVSFDYIVVPFDPLPSYVRVDESSELRPGKIYPPVDKTYELVLMVSNGQVLPLVRVQDALGGMKTLTRKNREVAYGDYFYFYDVPVSKGCKVRIGEVNAIMQLPPLSELPEGLAYDGGYGPGDYPFQSTGSLYFFRVKTTGAFAGIAEPAAYYVKDGVHINMVFHQESNYTWYSTGYIDVDTLRPAFSLRYSELNLPETLSEGLSYSTMQGMKTAGRHIYPPAGFVDSFAIAVSPQFIQLKPQVSVSPATTLLVEDPVSATLYRYYLNHTGEGAVSISATLPHYTVTLPALLLSDGPLQYADGLLPGVLACNPGSTISFSIEVTDPTQAPGILFVVDKLLPVGQQVNLAQRRGTTNFYDISCTVNADIAFEIRFTPSTPPPPATFAVILPVPDAPLAYRDGKHAGTYTGIEEDALFTFSIEVTDAAQAVGATLTVVDASLPVAQRDNLAHLRTGATRIYDVAYVITHNVIFDVEFTPAPSDTLDTPEPPEVPGVPGVPQAYDTIFAPAAASLPSGIHYAANSEIVGGQNVFPRQENGQPRFAKLLIVLENPAESSQDFIFTLKNPQIVENSAAYIPYTAETPGVALPQLTSPGYGGGIRNEAVGTAGFVRVTFPEPDTTFFRYVPRYVKDTLVSAGSSVSFEIEMCGPYTHACPDETYSWTLSPDHKTFRFDIHNIVSDTTLPIIAPKNPLPRVFLSPAQGFEDVFKLLHTGYPAAYNVPNNNAPWQWGFNYYLPVANILRIVFETAEVYTAYAPLTPTVLLNSEYGEKTEAVISRLDSKTWIVDLPNTSSTSGLIKKEEFSLQVNGTETSFATLTDGITLQAFIPVGPEQNTTITIERKSDSDDTQVFLTLPNLPEGIEYCEPFAAGKKKSYTTFPTRDSVKIRLKDNYHQSVEITGRFVTMESSTDMACVRSGRERWYFYDAVENMLGIKFMVEPCAAACMYSARSFEEGYFTYNPEGFPVKSSMPTIGQYYYFPSSFPRRDTVTIQYTRPREDYSYHVWNFYDENPSFSYTYLLPDLSPGEWEPSKDEDYVAALSQPDNHFYVYVHLVPAMTHRAYHAPLAWEEYMQPTPPTSDGGQTSAAEINDDAPGVNYAGGILRVRNLAGETLRIVTLTGRTLHVLHIRDAYEEHVLSLPPAPYILFTPSLRLKVIVN